MMQLFRMAYRDLQRNRRRSFLSALALGIGVALLLFMAAIIAGEMRDSMEKSIRLQTGHLQVRAPSYDENKTSLKWNDLIEEPSTLATQVATIPGVKTATPRLFAVGIAQKGDDTKGVSILGIVPESDASLPYRNALISGQFLTGDDREGILIGKTLANKLNINTGDNLYLLVNTSTGDVAQQNFAIRGVYDTHTPGIDESMVLMPLDKAQGITGTANHASAIFVLLGNRDQADAMVSQITGNYQVKTWKDMNSFVLEYEQLANGYMVLLYLIILGIAATVIVNTLIMAVFERTREIGILSAIGMKGGRIMTMFFAESGMLAAGGVVIGLVLGAVVCAVVARTGIGIPNFGATTIALGDRLYAYLTFKDAITLSIVTFIVSLLAAIYPAALAARMDPVEALHGGK